MIMSRISSFTYQLINKSHWKCMLYCNSSYLRNAMEIYVFWKYHVHKEKNQKQLYNTIPSCSFNCIVGSDIEVSYWYSQQFKILRVGRRILKYFLQKMYIQLFFNINFIDINFAVMLGTDCPEETSWYRFQCLIATPYHTEKRPFGG